MFHVEHLFNKCRTTILAKHLNSMTMAKRRNKAELENKVYELEYQLDKIKEHLINMSAIALSLKYEGESEEEPGSYKWIHKRAWHSAAHSENIWTLELYYKMSKEEIEEAVDTAKERISKQKETK